MSTLDSVARELKEPRRLSHQLTTVLAAEIVSGRLAAGEQFPSTEAIVNRFSVSRTVARETVQGLAMLGLVRIQHGKRTEVLPEDEWDILSSIVQEALRRRGDGRAAPPRPLRVPSPHRAACCRSDGQERKRRRPPTAE